ncbi:putative transcription factor interactor and regulator CCHC(Zn) family [Helianthus anomalus]
MSNNSTIQHSETHRDGDDDYRLPPTSGIRATSSTLACQHCYEEQSDRGKRNQRTRLCYYCHRPGHHIYECISKENDEATLLINQAVNAGIGIQTQRIPAEDRNEMIVTDTEGRLWGDIWYLDINVLSINQLTLQGFTVNKARDTCKLFPMFSPPVVNSVNEITGLTKEDELGLKEKQKVMSLNDVSKRYKEEYLNSYFEDLHVSSCEIDWSVTIIRALEFKNFGDCKKSSRRCYNGSSLSN